MKLIVLCLFLLSSTLQAKLCPDGAYRCPDSATCCQNRDTSYGCCPYRNADCCKDFIHCCPEGTHCNVTNRSCDSSKNSSLSFLWMVPHYHPKTVAVIFEEEVVVLDTKPLESLNEDSDIDFLFGFKNENDSCPDGSSCSIEDTCCPIGGDRYGCCPYQHADCCKDKVHCCPEGYLCDLVHSQCTKRVFENTTENSDSFPIFNIEKDEFELSTKKKKDLCDDCLFSGKVCCSNGKTVTCCPRGTTCSSGSKDCTKDISMSSSPSGLELFRSLNAAKMGTVCPDHTQFCPVHNTCCITSSGIYGCCPMPEATCCPDERTCCPKNYACIESGCERKPFLHIMNLPIFAERLRFP